eukprot:SAG22_NODE_17019_length_313_cov_0.714953_1_plen_48_part_10
MGAAARLRQLAAAVHAGGTEGLSLAAARAAPATGGAVRPADLPPPVGG